MPASVRAVLLAAGAAYLDLGSLREQGIEVQVFERTPSLQDLAAAALEQRQRHPRLPLVVVGPEKLVRELARRYPPLVDVALTASDPTVVLRELQSL